MRRTILIIIALLMFLGLAHGFVHAQDTPLDIIPPTSIPGYAQSLKLGGGDVISLVVLITNYVLGFLGIVSLTAVIYAGVLYVANFGAEDLTTKAKSIITYVAIGIVIIMMSYAIVNTLVAVVGRGGVGGGSSGGKITPGDHPVTTIDPFFDALNKDYLQPVITSLRAIGDLCPFTPIGLAVNQSGCAVGQLIPDTDSDGLANVLDKDIDNDGVTNDLDKDVDGDSFCDNPSDTSKTQGGPCDGGPDLCSDTLSFLSFKKQKIENQKLQADRVKNEADYKAFIKANQGCAEYQKKSDIDGDGVSDVLDWDADNDGLLDKKDYLDQFLADFPSGHDADTSKMSTWKTQRGVIVQNVDRTQVDADTDNDSVADMGAKLQPEARALLQRQFLNNFNELEGFIRITCATLPQTTRVRDFCSFSAPKGKLIQLLDDLSSDIKIVDFDAFNKVYQDFVSLAKTFPRVQANIKTSNGSFDAFLSSDDQSVKMNFDATDSLDPYQKFCPRTDANFFWYVNKTLNFNQGLDGFFSSVNPDGHKVFFPTTFTQPGVYNVQLLVRSACSYKTVNPGSTEADSVAAAIAGVASAQSQIFPAQAPFFSFE